MDWLKRVLRIFTWWNGPTVGTAWFTQRNGEKVGEDEAGNVYYQSHDGTRRWVIYNGAVEASAVPADWHVWLHHTFSEPPTKEPLKKWAWEKDHKANMTGTADAYRPKGSLLAANPVTPQAQYDAWRPE